MQDPNEDTQWNDVLRSKGILPPKEKEAAITEDTLVKVVLFHTHHTESSYPLHSRVISLEPLTYPHELDLCAQRGVACKVVAKPDMGKICACTWHVCAMPFFCAMCRWWSKPCKRRWKEGQNHWRT